MVQFVGDNGVLLIQKRLKYPAIRIECGGIENAILRSKELCRFAFQFLVNILRTTNETHRRHAVAVRINRVFGGFDDFRVGAKAQIVIGAEVQDFAGFVGFNFRALWRGNDAFLFKKASIFYFLKLLVYIKRNASLLPPKRLPFTPPTARRCLTSVPTITWVFHRIRR